MDGLDLSKDTEENHSKFICKKCQAGMRRMLTRFVTLHTLEGARRLYDEANTVWCAFDKNASISDCSVCSRFHAQTIGGYPVDRRKARYKQQQTNEGKDNKSQHSPLGMSDQEFTEQDDVAESLKNSPNEDVCSDLFITHTDEVLSSISVNVHYSTTSNIAFHDSMDESTRNDVTVPSVLGSSRLENVSEVNERADSQTIPWLPRRSTRLKEQMIVESVHTLVEHTAARPQEGSRRMSLVDLGKRLLEAAKRGETDTVRALMSNGAPFTTDWLGTSPLHFAAQYGHQETAEVLLRAGISRDARTKVDRTPLHVASQEGHMSIVQLLLQSNADIDAKDMLKMTPLHWSTEKGHVAIIGLLIRNGADTTLEDKFNRTPLDIALANGRTDIAHLFQLHQDATGVIEDSDTITIETPETLVTETVSTTDGVEGLVIDTEKLIKSEPDDSTDQSSTSVLATLAALAEATAPNSASHATTSAAMSWLESQGITMISGDGSLITSAVESGQTITLTEAGKIALNQLIQQEAVMDGGDATTEEEGIAGEITEESIVEHTAADGMGGEDGEEQGVITIVTSAEVGDEEEEGVEGGQIIMEEAIIQEGQDGVIHHMTDEEGNALVIEEAGSGLASAGDIEEEEAVGVESDVVTDGVTEETDEGITLQDQLTEVKDVTDEGEKETV